MTPASFNRADADGVLLAWLFAWSVALTTVVAGILHEVPSGDLPEDSQLIFGLAMGALSAVWITTGTWITLIQLPRRSTAGSSNSFIDDDIPPQLRRPRTTVSLVWIGNAALFCVLAKHDPTMIAQLLSTVMMGVTGPLIVWQWTRRRIHRGELRPLGRRSIREILTLTLIVAVAIATMRFCERKFEFSSSVTAMIISIALVWGVASMTMLGRWWGLAVITIPLVAVQWVTVLSLIELRGRGSEARVQQSIGVIVGFYLFALLFLALMRSSGHRWFDSQRLTGDPLSDETN